jgi:hypothetical protein
MYLASSKQTIAQATHIFAVEIAFLYQYSLVSGDGVILSHF